MARLWTQPGQDANGCAAVNGVRASLAVAASQHALCAYCRQNPRGGEGRVGGARVSAHVFVGGASGDVAGAVVVAVAAWSTAAGTTWVPAVPVADPEADAEADGLPATAAAATAAARHAPKARLIAHARGKGVLLRVLFVTAPRTTPSVKAAARILL